MSTEDAESASVAQVRSKQEYMLQTEALVRQDFCSSTTLVPDYLAWYCAKRNAVHMCVSFVSSSHRSADMLHTISCRQAIAHVQAHHLLAFIAKLPSKNGGILLVSPPIHSVHTRCEVCHLRTVAKSSIECANRIQSLGSSTSYMYTNHDIIEGS